MDYKSIGLTEIDHKDMEVGKVYAFIDNKVFIPNCTDDFVVFLYGTSIQKKDEGDYNLRTYIQNNREIGIGIPDTLYRIKDDLLKQKLKNTLFKENSPL